MLTLIFGTWASEPPPPPGPGERLKRSGLIELRLVNRRTIFCPNIIYLLCLYLKKSEKSGLTKQSFLHKNLECAKFTSRKYVKPTLHSLIANHVLEMSVKLKFQCVRFEKKHRFALVVSNWFPICFYQGLLTRCDLHHTILLYYFDETKEMIYESVNLKGVV